MLIKVEEDNNAIKTPSGSKADVCHW